MSAINSKAEVAAGEGEYVLIYVKRNGRWEKLRRFTARSGHRFPAGGDRAIFFGAEETLVAETCVRNSEKA